MSYGYVYSYSNVTHSNLDYDDMSNDKYHEVKIGVSTEYPDVHHSGERWSVHECINQLTDTVIRNTIKALEGLVDGDDRSVWVQAEDTHVGLRVKKIGWYTIGNFDVLASMIGRADSAVEIIPSANGLDEYSPVSFN